MTLPPLRCQCPSLAPAENGMSPYLKGSWDGSQPPVSLLSPLWLFSRLQGSCDLRKSSTVSFPSWRDLILTNCETVCVFAFLCDAKSWRAFDFPERALPEKYDAADKFPPRGRAPLWEKHGGEVADRCMEITYGTLDHEQSLWKKRVMLARRAEL